MNQKKAGAASLTRWLLTGVVLFLALGVAVVILKARLTVEKQGLANPNNTYTNSTPSMDLNTWRDTAAAAVMNTQLAMSKLVTPSPPPAARPPTRTSAPFKTGLFEVSQGTGYLWNYPLTTLWQAVIDGQRISVYAGGTIERDGATPGAIQGAMFVRVFSSDLQQVDIAEYPAPAGVGILRIDAVEGYRLSLMGPNGEELFFDVPSRQFVDSFTVAITAPTVKPIILRLPTESINTLEVYPGPLSSGYGPLDVYPRPETPTPLR